MNFEPATLANIDEMLKIEKKSFASHWNRQTFVDELSSDNGCYIVVKGLDRGKEAILGYTGFRYVLDEAHITTLAVHHKFRKKGIGSLLIEQLVKDARRRGLKKLFLEVRQSNIPAQKIYTKMGFKVLDRRREYYQHPVEDALVMQNDNI
jgi:[ribosomal protein S18]-alanine N-acetyltransferase